MEQKKLKRRINVTNKEVDNNFVFVKLLPSMMKDREDSIVAIDQSNRTDRWIITLGIDNKLSVNQCSLRRCPSIQFIDQMNDTLFKRIDSIVDYRIDDRFGHILLFDITGRPYYCSQPENESLSEKVFNELVCIQ